MLHCVVTTVITALLMFQLPDAAGQHGEGSVSPVHCQQADGSHQGQGGAAEVRHRYRSKYTEVGFLWEWFCVD